ncbi:cupin domain-containing protein [Parvularcula flava]|uniref:Cupin domain-containing protein n=1 Tax=Aquisalinus luteolus TaxID=1566827 RepID=A0A8J3A2W7_9PROT|nr:cupin domain-containing protein [Aquisalinus luteolus]NHK27687.1 cupin domain-containing protein [Aquisalinus luteolus]GGH96194.1 hypothetical protein GCM10011355_14520 [Aquisalinus luteolus]
MEKPAGEQKIKAHRLGDNYAHLCDDGSVMPIAVGPEFWQSQIGSLPPGRLISMFHSAEDWTVWEMHPHGDEWILQLSGSMTLILDMPDGETSVTLAQGEFAVVPKGIWHTADVIEPGEALFVTAGEGTSHRPR